MSWDQEYSRESIDNFLLRELGVDLSELIKKEIENRLREQNLSYEVFEDTSVDMGDCMVGGYFNPLIIEFSDGRIFTEACTESSMGDDWGADYYSFVDIDEPFEIVNNGYRYDGNDPHVTRDTHELNANPIKRRLQELKNKE